MKYKYVRPEGNLHRVSTKKWNSTFARRGRWPMVVAEVYLTEDKATIHYVPSVVGKTFFLLALPFVYIFGVIGQGAGDTHADILDVFFTKRRGAFSSDVVYKSEGQGWKKLVELVRN